MFGSSIGEMMSKAASTIGGLMVAYAMFQNYFPDAFRSPIRRYSRKLLNLLNPYVHITFPEYQGDGFSRSPAFSYIERYLNNTSTAQARRLKASVSRDSDSVVLSMENHEEVTDEFSGAKIWWVSGETASSLQQSIFFYPRREEKRYFTLTFHNRHRHVITSKYIPHVIAQGKAIATRERRRKLYTNAKEDGDNNLWNYETFNHPATFDTLAMDPVKKHDIINDLCKFADSKDYYAKIGKAWKRGYLLFGPPGTGKSSMIAAMANLLEYDVYDLELTSVKDNTELRKLLIDTSGKSIIVIEDIDCSINLTGQRKKEDDSDDEDEDNEKDEIEKLKGKVEKLEEGGKKSSEVTLSGLLNFIDGLWSACGGERIIVFTTNYVEKLDPALIRRGRMDKHIELSYCGFEAFKVLAKNYLEIEEHELFGKIRSMLEEIEMTPADVAENLMPKVKGEDGEKGLVRLIEALEEAKELASVKAEKLAAKEEQENEDGGKNKDLNNGEPEVQDVENGGAIEDVEDN
ncbi:P-loop containing nucleoside triphosphate hydrolases superfamily protein [Striga hermonthica]|uniref:P-loop containing nucleoside triphosphate hydrolases superfamily protein n=1 Tax=Striga hermonthica TaxID=68872 RepID=A0A9N7NXP2_STRHE|nr:P-loop containing nucleoside triphosphate hydrolases superfamily protein [Striga hermonthica]